MGPYVFLEYHGEQKLTAMVQDPLGREMHCSVANWLPMHAWTQPACLMAVKEQDIKEHGIWGDWEGDESYESEDESSIVVPHAKRPREWV